MRRALLVTYCMAIAALVSVTPPTMHAAEPAKSPPASDAAAATQAVATAPAVAAHDEQTSEILQLWRALGGSLLKGTLLERQTCVGGIAARCDSTTQCDSKAQCDLETEFLAVLQAQITSGADNKATGKCDARYQEWVTEATIACPSQGIEFYGAPQPLVKGYAITGYPTTSYPTPTYAPPRPVTITGYSAPTYESYSQGASTDGELAAVLRAASRRLDVKANDLEDMTNYDEGDKLRRLARRIRRAARELQQETTTAEVARKVQTAY